MVSIQSLDEFRQKNQTAGFDQLEESFDRISEEIQSITDLLEDYKSALFDEAEYGKSVKELYLTSSSDDPHIRLNQTYRKYNAKAAKKFVLAFSTYMDHLRTLESEAHFWTLGPSFDGFRKGDLEKVKQSIDEVYSFGDTLKKESGKFTKNEIDFETALFFLSCKELLDQLKTNLKNEVTYSFFVHMVDQPPDQDTSWLSNMERTLLQCFKGAGPETSLPSSELGRFQEALEHAIKARKGLISWIRWRLFSEEKIFITRVLVANDLKSNKNGFEVLLQKIDNRLNFEHQVSQLKDVLWLKDFPNSFRVIDIQNWFFYQKLALKSYQLRDQIRSLPNYIQAKNETREHYVEVIDRLIKLVDLIPRQLAKWEKHLSETQVRMMLLKKIDRGDILNSLDHDFEKLVEYHGLKEGFDIDERKMVDELIEMEMAEQRDAVEIFNNSLRIAWIDHIEQKYPVLRLGTQLDEKVKNLQQLLEEKMQLSREILLMNTRRRALEGVYQTSEEFDYTELEETLSDPENSWPIRRIISRFREHVFSLLPCWMTTPEGATAIFPNYKLFDLVIFDEASQTLPERALPVIHRARSIVIVGDEKQLGPFPAYRDDLSTKTSSNVDSLLGMAVNYFPRIKLKRHYSGESQFLINFSNHYFYDDQLKFLPHFEVDTSNDTSIHLVNANGSMKKQINNKECNNILQLLRKLADKDISIGILTTTEAQQIYIMDQLNKIQVSDPIELPDSFFIKTVDTSQGDRRDIILFSTVYDSWGSIKDSSLSVNHINIAATRANKVLHIVTSLDTECSAKLDPEETSDLFRLFINYSSKVHQHKQEVLNKSSKSHSNGWYFANRLLRDKEFDSVISDTLPFANGSIDSNGSCHGIIIADDQLEDESPKDYFCHKLNLLREKKWPFITFNSREMWANRNGSLEKIQKFIGRNLN